MSVHAGPLAVAVLVVVLGTACFPPATEVTDAGKGLPDLTAEIPSVLESGSSAQLAVTIRNPGPGDMTSLIVSFSRVGASAQEELPEPLIDVGVGGESESILEIEPAAESVSQDATTYRFGSLAAAESVTIVFELNVPRRRGTYANAVVVCDGQDVERCRGVPIEVTVSD